MKRPLKGQPSSVEAIAKLLPPTESQRFLEVIARFRKVPEDDEHLQILEAIGFLTLIMNRIPDEIAQVIEKAESGLNDEQAAALQRRIETILKNSVDTPSYRDLREMVNQMKEERQQFKQTVNGLSTDIAAVPALPYPGSFNAKSLGIACLVSLIVGAILSSAALYAKLPDRLNFHFRPKNETDDLVDYFEDVIPELGGHVGVYVIHGQILSVDKDADKGIVITAIPNLP